MNLVMKIAKILMIVVGVFFLVMSLDVFSMDHESIWHLIVGFLFNSSPGILLITAVLILWNKEHILAGVLFLAATAFIFFFKLYVNFPERLVVMLITCLPLYLVSILLVVYKRLKTGHVSTD